MKFLVVSKSKNDRRDRRYAVVVAEVQGEN
jgi:hypothetical protein